MSITRRTLIATAASLALAMGLQPAAAQTPRRGRPPTIQTPQGQAVISNATGLPRMANVPRQVAGAQLGTRR